MIRSPLAASLLAAASLSACATARAPAPALPARRQAQTALLAAHWESFLAHHPEFASRLGDKRWNDQSTDLSAAAEAAELVRSRELLARLEAIDPSGFPEQEALTRTLVAGRLRQELESSKFEGWKMPVNQMDGLHLSAPQLVRSLSFASVQDYDDYVARLQGLPRQLADTEANARLGIAAGLVQPRYLLEMVAAQADGIAALEAEQTPFAGPLASFPAAVPEADRARLRTALLAAIRDGVLPAYRRFARFVREDYAPRGRSDAGIWSLPDGEARYAALVKESTTTDLSPEEIHALGLREVARIESKMADAARRAGYPSLAAFRAAMAVKPELRPTSREQILAIYRGYLDALRPELPKLFGRLPKADFVVVPVEPFREKDAASAEYQEPAADGSRPGRVEVNTGDFASRTTLPMETTAYHEAIPGHHLQIALQQELEGLEPQRRFWLSYTAYVEGWALYAEGLAEELGRYQDPFSYYGHLQDEMLRAIRLVVDTGLHRKRWTREQVVQFFHDHSSLDEVDVQAETDRYVAWPGQALGYKIGELRIRELRERARRELGAAFDVRRFHDLILGAGQLPLDLLGERVEAFIAAEKVRKPGS